MWNRIVWWALISLCIVCLSSCGGGGGGGGDDSGPIPSDGRVDDFTVPSSSINVNNDVTLLANAEPDECTTRRTSSFPFTVYLPQPMVPDDTPPLLTPAYNVVTSEYECNDPDFERPKTNEAYVWGLALVDTPTVGDPQLWFGTGANVQCLVESTYLGIGDYPYIIYRDADGDADISAGPLVAVCEYRHSWILNSQAEMNGEDIPDLPGPVGDWRPPNIYSYNLTNDTFESRTASMDIAGKQLINNTLGLRSAGSIGNIVFLAGPSVPGYNPSDPLEILPNTSVNVFAFTSDGIFLGSYELDGYSNIRKWKEIDGHLYAVVTRAAPVTDALYGRVLKWVGNEADPFNQLSGLDPFVEVGILPGGGAELSEYGVDRIAVSTWPGGIEGASGLSIDSLDSLTHGGIYISTVLPPAGLNPNSAAQNFTEVFTFDQYDPDLARSYTYGGGALAYFDGWLIWGSMHVPATNAQAMDLGYSTFNIGTRNSINDCRRLVDDLVEPGVLNCDENSLTDQQWSDCVDGLLATADQSVIDEYDTCMAVVADYEVASETPAISIFRGYNLADSNPDRRTIDVLYGYETLTSLNIPLTTQLAITQPGFSGFGSWEESGVSWNETTNGIGTPVFGEAGFGNKYNNYTWEMRITNNRLYVGTMDRSTISDAYSAEAGADLWSFVSARRPAVVEDINGLGNKFNYGLRTMLPGTSNNLFIGTANPFNLTDQGGWELLEVTPMLP